MSPRIERVFPHDSTAYTQGLVISGNVLYESTGTDNHSSLRKIDIKTGRVLKLVPVDDFAEGIAILDKKLFQLTWARGRVLIYDVATLKRVGETRIAHQGWGLTACAGSLVSSDGTSVLRFRNSDLNCFAEVRVTSYGIPVRHINDIEYNGNSIFANIWCSNKIVRISRETGRVSGIIDCSELWRIENPGNPHCILNGIAYNGQSDTFLLTGKYWKNYFEVRFPI